MARQSLFRNISDWLIRYRERIGIVFAGHTAKQIEEFLLDWVLYGWVSYYFTSEYGSVWGSAATFAVMAPLSAAMCLLYLKIYDWAKLDVFGFETIKSLRDLNTTSKGCIKRFWQRIIQLGDIPAFIALSIYGDPFMVTVYLRREDNQYSGLSRRDWLVFWGSVLSSNGYWTLRWTVIISVGRYVWNYLF